MSDNTKPTEGLDVRELVERGMRAASDDSGFRERQAELQRTENLRRADPRVTDEDMRMLRAGTLRKDTKALQAVLGWLERTDVPILILGSTQGAGKTVAAAWVLATYGGVYVHANDLARMWNGFARDRARVNELCAARIVALDDLGTEPDGAAMGPVLLDMIDRRQGARRRTIITTNQTKTRLRERYPDERLWSRLVRSSAYVGFTSPDLRSLAVWETP